jgi:hypothetical protein
MAAYRLYELAQERVKSLKEEEASTLMMKGLVRWGSQVLIQLTQPWQARALDLALP